MLLSSGALFLSSVLPSVDSFSAFTSSQLPISQHSSIDTTFLQALFPQPIPNHPLVTIILIPTLLRSFLYPFLPDNTPPILFPSFFILHNLFPPPLFHSHPTPLLYPILFYTLFLRPFPIPTPLWFQSRFVPFSSLPNSIIRCSSSLWFGNGGEGVNRWL